MVEDQRSKTVQETEKLYISPLQILVEKINRVRDERQKYRFLSYSICIVVRRIKTFLNYSKETSRFYQTLERNLNLKISTVHIFKKTRKISFTKIYFQVRKSDLREADTQLALQQRNFCQASLYYVCFLINTLNLQI
jgi:hypothetical protein